jgi:hypothetical protein
MNSLAVILVTALAVGVLLWLAMRPVQDNTIDWKEKLIEETLKSHASKEFDPGAATLVHKRDEVNADNGAGYLADCIYKRPDGEYFLFICEVGQPGYLTHLTRERAMNALRSNREVYEREFPDCPRPDAPH